jgi:hypothetical protein
MMKDFDVCKAVNTYFPIVLNINYSKDGKQYAFMNYGVFKKDSKSNLISGVKIIRQLVRVILLIFFINHHL